MKYELQFYTDYSQFFICDYEPEGKTDSDAFWTDEAHEEKLAIEEGILGVGIGLAYGNINVEVDIIDFENNTFEVNDYSHIVEGNLKIKSGILQVLDCPNSTIELQVTVQPGDYRVRIYTRSL